MKNRGTIDSDEVFESQEQARIALEQATAEAVAEVQARIVAEAVAQRHAESMLAEENEHPW
ncbi:MAG: hypothetical protein ACRELG_05490 [Gemmataceae bacterium]